MARQGYITLDDAAMLLGVKRPTLYYYIKTLKLETKKFQLDRRAYLKQADFEMIKLLKEQAAEKGETDNLEDVA